MGASSASAPPPRTADAPERLLTFRSGGWVLLIALVLTVLSAYLVLRPVFETGFQRAIGDGKHPETYGFDLSNLTISRGDLIASGKPKDGVRAVPTALTETMSVSEVEMMNKNEYARFLTPSDQVIGVEMCGEARAYPVRLMNLHEAVNDTLGGKPIVVTWSPLTGSAAVFERPDAKTEFGVSGLLYESNTILFDRENTATEESLWPQLAMRAVSGPAVGKSLKLLPFELTTWREWTATHSDTRVFRGLRTLKQQYTDAQDPFNLYFATDDIKFPVSPLPPFKGLRLKTPIVVATEDGAHWKASLAGSTAATEAEQGKGLRVYSFLFAWYAQHSRDTDYSAIAH